MKRPFFIIIDLLLEKYFQVGCRYFSVSFSLVTMAITLAIALAILLLVSSLFFLLFLFLLALTTTSTAEESPFASSILAGTLSLGTTLALVRINPVVLLIRTCTCTRNFDLALIAPSLLLAQLLLDGNVGQR